MSHPNTPEQDRILEAAKNSNTSLMIRAYAGCGKTSTLELIGKVMPIRPVLCLAFNVKNKKDMELRLPTWFKVQTMNGLGHNAFGKAIGKRCGVDNDKIYKLAKQVCDEERKKHGTEISTEDFTLCMTVVRRARMNGLVPREWEHQYKGLIPDNEAGWEAVGDSLYLDITPLMRDICREILVRSIKLAFKGELDYDDQIYMSALFGGVFPKFGLVLVDEAQDLSPLNHIQVAKSAADRLIVVGDPRQAIYAFRGADSESMDKLRLLRSEWVDLSLSVTFRCPKAVVERQQTHAVGFTAADAAPEGAVLNYMEKASWSVPDGQVAILCRNNAPLFACALRLIRSGLGVTLMGGDIGKSLIKFCRDLFPGEDTPVVDCIRLVNEWMDTEVSKARANEKEERVAVIRDKGECVLAVLENGGVLFARDVAQILTMMFSKESLRITLATGHKAKGMEWDTVIHLDPWRVPSKYAKMAQMEGNSAPLEQDLNLRYVIETRTKKTFIMANLEQLP